MWTLIGLALALFVAMAAMRKSRTAGGYYDVEVYGMTPRAHRRYAIASLAFALYFAIAYALHAGGAGLAALALYALVAIFYGTSFLRGFSDSE